MGKRIHRLLAEACVETLDAIFHRNMVADRAVARVLGAHPKWGARDRGFVAGTVYEVVRWRRRLAVLAGAGEEDWLALCGAHWMAGDFGRPDWAAWPEVSADDWRERGNLLESAAREVRQSVSPELDAIGYAELGEEWDRELTALNRPASVFLRVNQMRVKSATVQAELAGLGIETNPVPGTLSGLEVSNNKSVPAKLRESGHFEIQDAGSQQVAPFLLVEPGQKVIDACAGAGGKTLHLSALLAGKGELRAMDVQAGKLATLRLRAARAGAKIWTATVSEEVLSGMNGWADRVLVDAPCSGSGTIRRQADLKYRITAETLATVIAIQREVVRNNSRLVRPGGRLVYATCSVLPSENQAQAAWFSREFPDFAFEEERVISPAATGWDGFYMARWRRKQ